jgi:hypothetical protein
MIVWKWPIEQKYLALGLSNYIWCCSIFLAPSVFKNAPFWQARKNCNLMLPQTPFKTQAVVEQFYGSTGIASISREAETR